MQRAQYFHTMKTSLLCVLRVTADCSRVGKQTQQIGQTRRKCVLLVATLVFAAAVFATQAISFTRVPRAPPLSRVYHPSPHRHSLPLLFVSFFSLSRRIARSFESEPLHSSRAVGRARDSSSRIWNKDDQMPRTMLTDERRAGPVVRTMPE